MTVKHFSQYLELTFSAMNLLPINIQLNNTQGVYNYTSYQRKVISRTTMRELLLKGYAPALICRCNPCFNCAGTHFNGELDFIWAFSK